MREQTDSNILSDQEIERLAGLAEILNAEEDWHQSLANAIRSVSELLTCVGLPATPDGLQHKATEQFPIFVSHSYIRRMQWGDPADPLLRQVLASGAELINRQDFTSDAVGDTSSRLTPGLLKKYEGRALLIATGTCAIHCRYCFRRSYPYGQEPRQLSEWEPAIAALRSDSSIQEVILSGGDPLMLTDQRLADLCERLHMIPHLKRLRIHTRLPIVLPNRVTDRLMELLQSLRLQVLFVVHANHPHEIERDCPQALRKLVLGGFPVLNQSVLLKGINDDARVLTKLSERLIDLGVIPYYLHQLDRVTGTGHFEVPIERGREIIAAMRRNLPGYGVPTYVQEVAGAPSKVPL